MRRLLLLLSLVLTGLALLVPATASADLRRCSGADPDNGITKVRVQRVTCSTGLAVAKRTNSVKCFLNGTRCTHRFRGRRWTCRLSEGPSSPPVTCRAGRRVVRYRLGQLAGRDSTAAGEGGAPRQNVTPPAAG